MLHNFGGDLNDRATIRRPRQSGSWMKLLGQVLELGGGQAQLLRHSDRPWGSATFAGTRHRITLTFEGDTAVPAGEALIGLLPDHEFNIPGQIVADAAVVEVTHVHQPVQCLTVELELLLLEDI